MARKHRKLPNLSPQDIQRFWSKVSKDPGQGPKGDCWEWQRRKLPDGYAQFSVYDDNYYAHRIAYLIQFGFDPAEKLVCHSCDNRACCRGDHFFLGTDKDNVRDCVSKKRRAPMPHDKKPKGVDHFRAILTEDNVRAIRASVGVSDLILAEKYGVHHATIWHIRKRKTWKHLS